MALAQEIRSLLREFATNWGQNWPETFEVLDASWQREFKSTPYAKLRTAVHHLMANHSSQKMPNLGLVIEHVKAEMGAEKSSHRDESLKKCVHCNEQGFREIAIHYEETPTKYDHNMKILNADTMGSPSVWHGSVKCDCDFGLRNNKSRKVASLKNIRERYAKTMQDRPNCLRYVHVCQDGKSLTMEQRTLAEDYLEWTERPKETNRLLESLAITPG